MMDTWTGAAGWIVAFIFGAVLVLFVFWHDAETKGLHKQISDTERELWLERKKNSDLMNERSDMRRGIIPPWPPARDGRRMPVTTIPRKGDND